MALVVLGDAAAARGARACARRYYDAFLACPFPERGRMQRAMDAQVREKRARLGAGAAR